MTDALEHAYAALVEDEEDHGLPLGLRGPAWRGRYLRSIRTEPRDKTTQRANSSETQPAISSTTGTPLSQCDHQLVKTATT